MSGEAKVEKVTADDAIELVRFKPEGDATYRALDDEIDVLGYKEGRLLWYGAVATFVPFFCDVTTVPLLVEKFNFLHSGSGEGFWNWKDCWVKSGEDNIYIRLTDGHRHGGWLRLQFHNVRPTVNCMGKPWPSGEIVQYPLEGDFCLRFFPAIKEAQRKLVEMGHLSKESVIKW